MYHWPLENVRTWFERRKEIEKLIVRLRLGKRGLGGGTVFSRSCRERCKNCKAIFQEVEIRRRGRWSGTSPSLAVRSEKMFKRFPHPTRGLRPFGSKANISTRRNTGARLTRFLPGVATKQRPLESIMMRLEKWFNEERAHRREVWGQPRAANYVWEPSQKHGRATPRPPTSPKPSMGF